ncbi:MAG: hypothetical protein ABIV94_04260 [Acidimicrobiales bacterium]
MHRFTTDPRARPRSPRPSTPRAAGRGSSCSPATGWRSVARFLDGDPSRTIECIPSCCSADNPARYAPINAGEWLQAKVVGGKSLSVVSGAVVRDERLGAHWPTDVLPAAQHSHHLDG